MLTKIYEFLDGARIVVIINEKVAYNKVYAIFLCVEQEYIEICISKKIIVT